MATDKMKGNPVVSSIDTEARNDIKIKARMKQYLSLGDLGLPDTGVTMQQIISTMEDNSVLIAEVNTTMVTDVPRYGTLEIVKVSELRVSCTHTGSHNGDSNSVYSKGKYYSGTWNGWDTLVTERLNIHTGSNSIVSDVSCEVMGKLATLTFYFTSGVSLSNGQDVYTLPTGFRPKRSMRGVASAGGNDTAKVLISTTGAIRVNSTITFPSVGYFTISYLIP